MPEHATTAPSNDGTCHIDRSRVKYSSNSMKIRGSGSYGSVYEGTLGRDSKVAIKEFKMSRHHNEASIQLEKIRREVALWARLRHPNILPLYGANLDHSPPFIVCRLAENNDATHFFVWNKKHKWRLLCDAALGIEYLHSENIVHGDIKLTNIVVDKDTRGLIADFGFAREVNSQHEQILEEVGEIAGALRWRAPECLTKLPSFQADVYSLGMCVIEAFTCQCPFDGVEDTEVIPKLKRGEIPRRPEGMSDDAWALVSKMTAREPSDRMSIEEVVVRFKTLAKQEENDELLRTLLCDKCQNSLRPNAKFCSKCGAEQPEREDHPSVIVEFDERRSPMEQVRQLVEKLNTDTEQNNKRAFATKLFYVVRSSSIDVLTVNDLEGFLDHIKSPDSHVQQRVAHALKKILVGNEENQKNAANCGMIHYLVDMLRGEIPVNQGIAAELLECLVHHNSDNQNRARKEGAMSSLLKLAIQSKYFDTSLKAIDALAALVHNNDVSRRDIFTFASLDDLVFALKARDKTPGVSALYHVALAAQANRIRHEERMRMLLRWLNYAIDFLSLFAGRRR